MSAIVVCSWGGGADLRGVEEVFTLARKAAALSGAALDWLVLGPLPEGAVAVAARHGVASIDHVAHPALAEVRPDVVVEALARYCTEAAPRAVLFSQTHDARLIVPRLAGRLGTAVVMNAVDFTAGDGGVEVVAAVYGGDVRAVYAVAGDGPWLAAVPAGAVTAAAVSAGAGRAAPTVRERAIDLAGVRERISVVRRAAAGGPRLEDARIVVAGGRGLGSADNFRLVERLAELLGGLPGASRAIVDDGWVDASRQIGLTGKVTKPELYIAAGISGASQHMAGCAAAKVIVAINRDPTASIFRYARYGIVGDAREVLEELIRAVEGQ
jgi:electron transfer flavoprotein alpha subunit